MTRIPLALRRSSVSPVRSRALLIGAAVATAGLLLSAGPAAADWLTPESGGSPNADRIDTLYKIVLGVAAIVFVGVEGALIYALVKFRARKGRKAEQIHGNTKLEIGWTAGAALIVVVLSVVTFAMLPGIRDPEDSDADGWAVPASFAQNVEADAPKPPNGRSLNIDVSGQQYAWRYVYPDGDGDNRNNAYAYEEMVVPTGTTITLDIRAQDVGHAWWIPELGGKADATPGYVNHTWFKVPTSALEGKAERTFRGQCAELCGRNHANMTARVRAMRPDAFQRWLDAQKRSIAANDAAAQRYRDQRRQLDQQSPSEASGGARASTGDSAR